MGVAHPFAGGAGSSAGARTANADADADADEGNCLGGLSWRRQG